MNDDYEFVLRITAVEEIREGSMREAISALVNGLSTSDIIDASLVRVRVNRQEVETSELVDACRMFRARLAEEGK